MYSLTRQVLRDEACRHRDKGDENKTIAMMKGFRWHNSMKGLESEGWLLLFCLFVLYLSPLTSWYKVMPFTVSKYFCRG